MNIEVDEYINKQKSPQKEVFVYLRSLIRKTIPEIKEEVKWSVPVFAGGKFYIGSLKNHVNLGFSMNGLNGKEVAFFEGSGKIMRHKKLNHFMILTKKN